METAGLPMPGYHYIAPNHIVKAPIHWMMLGGVGAGAAAPYQPGLGRRPLPLYRALAPIYFLKHWTSFSAEGIDRRFVTFSLNVRLHLLRVYKYFRYSYIYSPLYVFDWTFEIVRNVPERLKDFMKCNFVENCMTEILKFWTVNRLMRQFRVHRSWGEPSHWDGVSRPDRIYYGDKRSIVSIIYWICFWIPSVLVTDVQNILKSSVDANGSTSGRCVA